MGARTLPIYQQVGKGLIRRFLEVSSEELNTQDTGAIW